MSRRKTSQKKAPACEMLHIEPNPYDGRSIEYACLREAVATHEGLGVCFVCARELQKEGLEVRGGLPRKEAV